MIDWGPLDPHRTLNICRITTVIMMSIGRVTIAGIAAWALMAMLHSPPPIAIGAGVFSAFITEVIIQINKKRQLKHKFVP